MTPLDGAARGGVDPGVRTPARSVALSRGLALLYVAAIFWESSQADPFPFVSRSILSHDKLAHLLLYAGLAFVIRLALRGTRLGPLAAFAGAVAIASAYGVTDELHQLLVPGRSCDLWDWAADTLGALIGAGAAAASLRRWGGAG